MGAFSLKISIAPSGETIAQIKKNLGGGVQKWDAPPLSPCKYGGDRGSRAGCRRKSVMFFCLFVCHALELRSLW